MKMTKEEFEQEVIKGERFFIPLGQEMYAEVDGYNVLWLLSMGSWWYHKSRGYACVSKSYDDKTKNLDMHKIIAEKIGLKGEIDHEDRDKLNNMEYNFRECTHGQNVANTGLRCDNKLQIKGVHYNEKRQKYIVDIRKGNKRYCEYYDNIDDARKRAIEIAIEFWGEFACFG